MNPRDQLIERLQADLALARERERALRDARRAMVSMVEELNETAAAVKRAEREWEATFDAIGDPLFIHDRNSRIVRANRAYAACAGRSFKEIIGKPYHRVFPLMDRPFPLCETERENPGIEGSGDEAGKEIVIQAGDKTYKVRSYPVPFEGDGGYSVHILENITYEKTVEARLREEASVSGNLLAIAEATGRTQEIEHLMEDVTAAAARVLQSDVCLAYLVERETRLLIPCQAFGLPASVRSLFRTESLSPETGFVRDLFERRETRVLDFPRSVGEGAGDFFHWMEGASRMMAIPLTGRTGLSGLLLAFFSDPVRAASQNPRVIQGISRQVSSALEEARLSKESVDRALELSHKMEMIRVMHEIDRSILSTLDVPEILDATVRLIGKILPVDSVRVAVVDRERGGFVYQAGFGIDLPRGNFTEAGTTSAAEVLNTGRVQFIGNLQEEKDLLPGELKLLNLGLVSHIRIPLVVRGEIAAILSVSSRKPGAFTRIDLASLENLATQVGIALENARLLTDLHEIFWGLVKTLSNTIDAKSPWTRGHSERVTEYSLAVGQALGFERKGLEDLRVAGLLHDIGKIGIADEVLDKPGKLSAEELSEMEQHSPRGAELLSPIRQLRHIVPWIRHHHERYDGKGYPDRLKGEAIPIQSRILSVADTFDAMTARRPYRETPGWDRALEELRRYSGIQFDPEIVEVFLKTMRDRGG